MRQVAKDALVTLGAVPYSFPVEYEGKTVSVHESDTNYEIFHQDRLIARHAKTASHGVVMEPAHVTRNCCGRGGYRSPATPLRLDPYFEGFGAVLVRDFQLSEAISRRTSPLNRTSAKHRNFYTGWTLCRTSDRGTTTPIPH